MMKNTLVVSQADLISNFSASMLEMLRDGLDDGVVENEFVRNIKRFADDLVDINDAVGVAGPTLQRLFREGHTMMLLNPKDFYALEDWANNNEDFQVVIFNADGSPVTLLQKKDVQW
jgi:hypothetical protein